MRAPVPSQLHPQVARAGGQAVLPALQGAGAPDAAVGGLLGVLRIFVVAEFDVLVSLTAFFESAIEAVW